jgi:folate-binding protein YgfZ
VTTVVRVAGADAATYLQGQLSQDIAAIAVGADAWSFVLEPNGHIDALVRVARVADDCFDLSVDDALAVAVETRLRKFLLRTKATVEVQSSDEDVDEYERIAEGRPGPAEIDDRAVPAETGWVSRAASFTKGCYTGQELVARMDSRVAEPPRRLVRLAASGELAAGTPIAVDGNEVGVVTSSATRDGRTIALGYVKRGALVEGEASVDGVVVTIEGPVGD